MYTYMNVCSYDVQSLRYIQLYTTATTATTLPLHKITYLTCKHQIITQINITTIIFPQINITTIKI
jgi:hypothetical protein